MGEMPPSPTVPRWRTPSASVCYTGPGSLLVRVDGEIDTAGVPVVRWALDGVWSQGASGRTCAVAAGDPRRLREARTRAVRWRAGPGLDDGLTDSGET